MISRREFIKISALSASAFAAGAVTKNIINNFNNNSFGLFAFLPEDKSVITKTISLFKRKTGYAGNPVIFSDILSVNEIIKKEYENSFINFYNFNEVVITAKKIDKINADIFLSDSKHFIYNPENNFDKDFFEFRHSLRNLKGEIFFSAQANEKKNEKSRDFFAVIENDKGIFDRINLKNSFNEIHIPGKNGKTIIKISNGLAKVTSSSCRHKLCEKMSASFPGNIIACVPNKVIIKVEPA